MFGERSQSARNEQTKLLDQVRDDDSRAPARREIEKQKRRSNATADLRVSLSARRAVTPCLYDDLYFTEQPYGLVCGFETGLPAMDSSSAALT
jgi:hypothetical protein